MAALLAAISIPVPAQSWRSLEKKLARQPELSGSDAVVLLDSTGVRFKDSGSGSFDIRQVIKIQTKAGALAHRVLKYDYDPLTALAVFEEIKVYKADGSVTLTFAFNGIGLDGCTVVAFETLCTEGKEVAVHADIDDEDQSVQFPGIRTTIKDKLTGIDHTEAGKSVTVIDTVRYAGLIPGKEYTVKGSLVNKATGEGLGITAEKTFTPEKPSGDVDVEFTFDASLLAGTTVVAFETLYSEDIEVAAHADIEDEDQTFCIPKISTNAKDEASETKTVTVSENTSVTDAVTYQGLAPGREYVLRGVLIDKETGKAMLTDGKEVSAEISFTPKMPDGEIEISFSFNATLLRGRTLVVFERLYLGEYEVASHTDPEDPAQTLKIPPAPEGPGSRSARRFSRHGRKKRSSVVFSSVCHIRVRHRSSADPPEKRDKKIINHI